MFFKYPHTPHLVWLGPGQARGDKLLSDDEREVFLADNLVVEEKVDGANIGISVANGDLAIQNRGGYIHRPSHVQFAPLWPWIEERRHRLVNELGSNLILFGEWCYAVHTVQYDALPDWLLGFDVYDREMAKFWSVDRRNDLLARAGLFSVPEISRGHYDIPRLKRMATSGRARYGSGPVEGIYLRSESSAWLEHRAKIVRPEFSQAIQEHWSGRTIQRNYLRRAG